MVNSEVCQAAAEVLAHHVSDHDPGVRQTDETVVMAGGRIRCTTAIDESWEGDGSLIPFWFEIEVELSTDVIRESIAGQGEDAHEAVVYAIHSLLDGVLPPIRHALGMPWPDDDVATGRIVSLTTGQEPIAWDIHFGSPLLLGSDQTDPHAIRSVLDQHPPIEFFADELTGVLPTRRLHWAKALLIATADHEPQGDVAIDNESYPESFERLSAFAWPVHDAVWGFRQFILVSPSPSEPTKEEVESARRAGNRAH
jgi:hypothetical protein